MYIVAGKMVWCDDACQLVRDYDLVVGPYDSREEAEKDLQG